MLEREDICGYQGDALGSLFGQARHFRLASESLIEIASNINGLHEFLQGTHQLIWPSCLDPAEGLSTHLFVLFLLGAVARHINQHHVDELDSCDGDAEHFDNGFDL